ncbi:hypothetical protein AAC387_Pa04g1807 [Persea americana]
MSKLGMNSPTAQGTSPSSGYGFWRLEKATGAAKILGLDEVEALQSELAFRRSIWSTGEEFVEDGEIHGEGEAGELAIRGADAGGREEGEIEKP